MIVARQYSDIVASFNIDALQGAVDAQLTPGELLKLTSKDAEAPGDEKFNAWFRLVRGWQLNTPALEFLFNSVVPTPAGEEGDAKNDMSFAPDDSGSHREANAGTMMVIMTNLLQRFRTDLGVNGNDWRIEKPLHNSYSVGALIEASANSYKNQEDWAAEYSRYECFTKQQMKSVEVIADALQTYDLGKLARNVSVDVLELLSDGSFYKLSETFFNVAKGMSSSD